MDFQNYRYHKDFSEGLSFRLLQYCIGGLAKTNLQSHLIISKSMVIDDEEAEDLVSSYPEMVKYFLRTYETEDLIAQAYRQVILMKIG